MCNTVNFFKNIVFIFVVKDKEGSVKCENAETLLECIRADEKEVRMGFNVWRIV